MAKKDSKSYKALWKVVDGALKDVYNSHPEFFTNKANRSSMTKRVVGSVLSYAAVKKAQKAKGRV